MPLCVLCKTQFLHPGYLSQAEPCDCGARVTQRDIDEMGPDEYDRLKAAVEEPEIVEEEDCTECHGDGEIIMPASIYGPNACTTCPVCDGTGKQNADMDDEDSHG